MAYHKLFSFILPLLIPSIFSQEPLTFTNPILDRNSADPSVLLIGSSYYLTLSESSETELTIYKSPILTSFHNAPSYVAYRTPPGYSDLWASEMHLVDGSLYLHFTMRTTSVEWRMYSMKALDPTDPFAGWESPVRMLPDWDHVAIDGTIMKHGDKLYYVWSSGRTGRGSIYIAEMDTPTSTVRPYVMIKHPTEEWECDDICTSEGPYVINNRNVSYLIFSGSMTWRPNYCLGQMSVNFGDDPLDPNSWREKEGGCVFRRNDEESVYTTGHASFTTSPDGTETWMVYHATESPTQINGYRNARVEKIEWDEVSGEPVFPKPHGYNHPQPVPSGQTALTP